MRILIDMDSIIVNLDEAWYPEINRRFGDELTTEKVTSWDVPSFSKGGQAIYSILKEPGFYASLKPLPGAIEGMRELLADPRYEVFILSYAPNAQAFKEKADWLAQWLPELEFRRIIFCYAKWLVQGDVLFDDAPHNLRDWQDAHPWGQTATIRYPYSESEESTLKHRFRPPFVAGDWTGTAAAWRRFLWWLDSFSS